MEIDFILNIVDLLTGIGGSWRPTSPTPSSSSSISNSQSSSFRHSTGLPNPSTSSSSSSSSSSSTPSTSAPPTPTLTHSSSSSFSRSSSTHSIPPPTPPARPQRPHKVQQSLLKFMMYLFDSSADFQAACTQLEFVERLIAIAFPNGSLAIGDSSDEDAKVWQYFEIAIFELWFLLCCVVLCGNALVDLQSRG